MFRRSWLWAVKVYVSLSMCEERRINSHNFCFTPSFFFLFWYLSTFIIIKKKKKRNAVNSRAHTSVSACKWSCFKFSWQHNSMWRCQLFIRLNFGTQQGQREGGCYGYGELVYLLMYSRGWCCLVGGGGVCRSELCGGWLPETDGWNPEGGKGQLKIHAHTAGRLGPPCTPPDKEAMSVLW